MSRRQQWLIIWLLVGLITAGCGSTTEVVPVTRIQQDETPATVEVQVTRIVTVIATAPAGDNDVVTVTRIVPEVIEQPSPGSQERPIQLVIAPIADEQITTFRAEKLADDLAVALNVSVELVVAEDYASVVTALCERPAETIALLPGPLAYLSEMQCNAQPALVAEKNGVPYTSGMLFARNDLNITSLTDLNGLTWGIPSENAWGSYLYFQALLAEQGITPGEISVTNGNSNTVLALYNEEVEFATASFLPPLLPFLEEWEYGEDDPEIWRTVGLAPYRHPRGMVVVLARAADGGYQIRDARANVFDVQPDIFATTSIVVLGGQIPNETLVLSNEFPIATARAFVAFMSDYVGTEACQQSVCSGDFYIWDGLEAITPQTFADIAFTAENLKLDASELLARYDN